MPPKTEIEWNVGGNIRPIKMSTRLSGAKPDSAPTPFARQYVGILTERYFKPADAVLESRLSTAHTVYTFHDIRIIE